MEGIWGMILNMENGRMLALAVLGYFGYMRLVGQIKDVDRSLEKKIDALDSKIDGVESIIDKKIDALDHKIDGVESIIDKKIDEKLIGFHALMKANDFAHLNNTIEALTFTLEKNGFLKREDKEYIDTRLDK